LLFLINYFILFYFILFYFNNSEVANSREILSLELRNKFKTIVELSQ